MKVYKGIITCKRVLRLKKCKKKTILHKIEEKHGRLKYKLLFHVNETKLQKFTKKKHKLFYITLTDIWNPMLKSKIGTLYSRKSILKLVLWDNKVFRPFILNI